MSELIKNNQHVILIDNSQNRRIFQIKEGQKVQHYKNMIDLNQLVGK